jgi:hypothetical protein
MPSKLDQVHSTSGDVSSRQVTRREWRRAWILIGVIATIIGLPYLIAAWSTPPDRVYNGFLMGRIGIEDLSTYLSKMQQGAHGAWLMHLPYTAQPHSGTLFYLIYILLGKVCALFGMPMIVGFHAMRVVAAIALLLVTYRFIAEFVPLAAVRWLAIVLTAVSGGVGWVFFLLGQATINGIPPLELMSPEAYTFWLIFTQTHLSVARIFLLLGAIAVWRAGAGRPWRLALLAGIAWLITTMLQPIFFGVIVAIGLLMILSRSILERRIVWRQLKAVIIAGAIALPMIIYAAIVFATDPVYGQWTIAQVTTSAAPWFYLLSYGIPLALAIPGWIYAVRQRESGLLFLALWMICIPLLIYAPTIAQRRLIESWQIVLSVIASYGLIVVLLPAFRRSRLIRQLARHEARRIRRWQRWAINLLVALMIPTYMFMLLWSLIAAASHDRLFYYDRHVYDVAQWLEQHGTYDDGVIAAYSTSTLVPTLADVRVLAGHETETAWVDERRAELRQFFQGDTSDVWRRDLLQRFALTYVFYGPDERALGSFDPAQAPYLKLVFESGDVRLYHVEL